MKYKSELINEIIETGGHVTSTLHYQSECVETWIEEVRGAYPKLADYEGEWLNYYLENAGVGEFPYLALTNITSATVDNCVPISFKRAILKGKTDENLQSVQMPVLKTANINNLIDTNPNSWHIIDGKAQIIQNKPIKVQPNTTYSLFIDRGRWAYIFKCDEFGTIEKQCIGNNKGGGTFVTDDDCYYVIARNDIYADVTRAHTDKMRLFQGTEDLGYTGYVDEVKTNILTVNEPVELRGIGEVRDTLDCLTGEVTERIGEIVLDGSSSIDFRKLNETSSTILFGILDCYEAKKTDGYSLANAIGDVLIQKEQSPSWKLEEEYFAINSLGEISISLLKNKLTQNDVDGLKIYLQSNPITIQYELATESIKTVDLSITNQDGESLNKLKAIEGTMHIETASETIKPLLDIEVPVEAITQNLNSFIEEE